MPTSTTFRHGDVVERGRQAARRAGRPLNELGRKQGGRAGPLVAESVRRDGRDKSTCGRFLPARPRARSDHANCVRARKCSCPRERIMARDRLRDLGTGSMGRLPTLPRDCQAKDRICSPNAARRNGRYRRRGGESYVEVQALVATLVDSGGRHGVRSRPGGTARAMMVALRIEKPPERRRPTIRAGGRGLPFGRGDGLERIVRPIARHDQDCHGALRSFEGHRIEVVDGREPKPGHDEQRSFDRSYEASTIRPYLTFNKPLIVN